MFRQQILVLAMCLSLLVSGAKDDGRVHSRQKRGILAEFFKEIGKKLIDYGLEEGLPKLTEAIKNAVKLRNSRTALEGLELAVEESSSNIRQLILDREQEHFVRDIRSSLVLLTEEFSLLKGNSTLTDANSNIRRQAIVSDILDDQGIEHALRQLHLTLVGLTTYGGKEVLEKFMDTLLKSHNDEETLVEHIEHKVNLFLAYLFGLQDLGFLVWHAAVSNKYLGDEVVQEYYQDLVMERYNARREKQANHTTSLLKYPTCDNPNRTLITRGDPQSTVCTGGVWVGGLCLQCAGALVQPLALLYILCGAVVVLIRRI